jgi:hypothetical protein
VTVKTPPAIDTVPVRAAEPVLSATASVTVPGPVPVAPATTVIHDAFDAAVHGQPLPDVTVTVTDDAAPPTETPLLDRLVVQALPACEMLNAWPPIVSVPMRVNGVLFAGTEYWTVPSPLPGDPDVTVIHVTLLDADHAHPAGAEIATDPLEPKPLSETEIGESVRVHAMPDWVTVTVWPAIVTVPVRVTMSGLLATLNDTDPAPVPLAPDAIVIHGTELLAVHAQLPAVLTVTVLNADVAVSEMLVCDTTAAHVGAACVTVYIRPPMVIVPVRAAFVVFALVE